MISPHKGMLIDRVMQKDEADVILSAINKLPSLTLDEEQAKDVRNIATGVYSPLIGFLKEKDFKSAVTDMRLSDGTLWPIPIVLHINEDDALSLQRKEKVILKNKEGSPFALLESPDIYKYDRDLFAEKVYGTKDKAHPGVNEIYETEEYLAGGDILLFDHATDLFPQYNLSPAETRKHFQMRGWKNIVAFQTRNVPHGGHEFLQKHALNSADGLFIQPVIGKKKADDFRDEHIISSYEILIDNYYPKNKVKLGILPLKMRYAGPREAIFHAIIRQNFGCTHFIVGRDHAGVKNYYPAFAAQEIFDTLKPRDLEIQILKYPEVVFSKDRQEHCFIHECDAEDRLLFSGTKLREHIKNNELPPSYMIRPEIFHLLTNAKNLFAESMAKEKTDMIQKGFTLWFTGLSQAGKSTIAELVYEDLKKQGVKTESLDGDIVRETLTKDLGFSKEDRNTNIRRVGFVAKLLSRNDIGVISAFITPFKNQRDELRLKIPNFIEVYVNTPLEECEKRDRKGLYAKARAGEIQNFTGISDPYEAPENPEIELDTINHSATENARKVVQYLFENGFIIREERGAPAVRIRKPEAKILCRSLAAE